MRCRISNARFSKLTQLGPGSVFKQFCYLWLLVLFHWK